MYGFETPFMTSTRLLWSLSFSALFIPGAPASVRPVPPAIHAETPAFRLEKRPIDALVRDAMQQWRVPGTAVVVVQGNRVEYLAGHGEGIDPDTIFPLASCSKAFTVEAIAQLLEKGRMTWDDPVRRHLDWFHLGDSDADGKVTLRDLLSHRTGVASHDLLWYHAPWSPKDAVRRLAFLPLSKPFRSTMQYQSTMYTAAGLAIASAEGKSWADVIRDRILVPLRMTRTSTVAPGEAESNRARPHRRSPWGVEPMALYPLDAPNAAGSIHSTARDLGTWLRWLLSRKPPREMWRQQIAIVPSESQKKLFPATQYHNYGMGWVLQDYHGLDLVSHGGAIDGFRLHITLVPSRKLGIAILTNLDQTPMALPLSSTLLDTILGLPPTDWNALHLEHQQRLADEARRFESPPANARPPRPLSAYAGAYAHPAYDELRLVVRADTLVCRWRGEDAGLVHVRGDTFLIVSDLLGTADVVFRADDAGNVTGAEVGGRLGVTLRKK